MSIKKIHTEKQLFEQLSSYILFLEGILGAAVSLETSFENPAAW